MSKGKTQVDGSCVNGRWKYLISLADPCVPPNPSIHLSGTLCSPGLAPLAHTNVILSEEIPSDKEELWGGVVWDTEEHRLWGSCLG